MGVNNGTTELTGRMAAFNDLRSVSIVALGSGISLYLLFCKYNKFIYKNIKKNEKVEFWWTVSPGIWLFILSFPSLRTLYRIECQGKVPADLMLKVTGHQ